MKWSRLTTASALSAMALGLLTVSAAQAQDEWDTAGFVENATFVRDDMGISKSRNTAQFEFSKDFGTKGLFSNFRVTGTLRGTYDAAYDLNDDEWGENAGGARTFSNFGSSTVGAIFGSTETPWGMSLLGNANPGPLPPGFGFNVANNPNDGLKVLGEDFHAPGAGLTLGVPVRPCDKDSRGCGLKDYMDFDTNDLRFPEFNDRLDFIRELYVEGSIPGEGSSELFVRVGKQQVVWGRTDLFRVLDIINPVDYSRHNIYDELEDIRIPQWIATAEFRFGPTETFDDLNFQMVWNFDEFRPNALGQGGTPYSILDAGSFFRGMNNCWENGCTVSNFVPAAALGIPNDPGLLAADFAPGVIGIRGVDLPDWSLDNTQGGFKLEGVYNTVGFSFNYYHFFQQLPVLRGGIESMNAFTGEMGVWDHIVAFDIAFPEVDLFGMSLDFDVDSIESVFRVEATYTTGEEFANTIDPQLYSDSDMFRWVLGWDRNTFIPFLNKNRAFLLSAQIFGEHYLDHELQNAPLGKIGMPAWEDNYTMTFLIKGWYEADTISPQLIMAWDYEAEAGTIAPQVDLLISDNWRLIAGFNIKVGNGMRDQQFDDCRTCNPFPPFTASPAHSDPFQSGSVGLGGIEPLGRFRAGPLGSASAEDEFQLTLRYRF